MHARCLLPISNGRHYGVLEVIADSPTSHNALSDDDLDRADRWLTHLRPDATPDFSGPEIDRWHVPDPKAGMDEWQGEVAAGPRVAVLSNVEVTEATAEGFHHAVAVSLPPLVAWWANIMSALPELLCPLGCDRGSIWFGLQTCPASGPPVVDLTFGNILTPRKGAPARSVSPWHYGPIPVSLDTVPLEVLTEATCSLLRHFSYRHLNACIGALGLPLAGLSQ